MFIFLSTHSVQLKNPIINARTTTAIHALMFNTLVQNWFSLKKAFLCSISSSKLFSSATSGIPQIKSVHFLHSPISSVCVWSSGGFESSLVGSCGLQSSSFFRSLLSLVSKLALICRFCTPLSGITRVF